MKVVINKSFGIFQVSNLVYETLISRGWRTRSVGEIDASASIIVYNKSDYSWLHGTYAFAFDDDAKEFRTNPDLIEVIEQLGEDANPEGGQLKIVEIPDDIEWYIHNYDGIEEIHEVHRKWS